MSHVKPRTATVLIYHGDDLEQITELRRDAEVTERIALAAIEEAKERAAGEALRAGDEDPVAEARAAFAAAVKPKRDAYDAFVHAAAERATEVKVRFLGRRRFKNLVLAHQPRMVTQDVTAEDGTTKQVEVVHEGDRRLGVNTETFFDALLTYVDPDDTEVRTITSPVFKGAKDCQAFLDDEVGEDDYAKLWMKALELNGMAGSHDPKSLLFSATSTES